MFILWFSLLLGAEANILSLKSWCHEIASKIARKNACWYTHKMYLPSKQEKTHHSNTLTQNDRPTTVLYKWISLDFIFHFSLFFCRLLFSLCSAPFHSGLRPKNFALKNEIHSWIFLDWKYFRKKHPNGIGYFRPATAKKSSNKYEKNRREKKKKQRHKQRKRKKNHPNADLTVWSVGIFRTVLMKWIWYTFACAYSVYENRCEYFIQYRRIFGIFMWTNFLAVKNYERWWFENGRKRSNEIRIEFLCA